MAVPMLRDGEPLGAITIGRPAAGPFSDSQIALLQTFAEQAVIAITSAETYRELQERTAALAKRNSEYGERIEQQAATIDVLEVMSASPGNAQPVFELIAERARAFCEADGVAVTRGRADADSTPAFRTRVGGTIPRDLQCRGTQIGLSPGRSDTANSWRRLRPSGADCRRTLGHRCTAVLAKAGGHRHQSPLDFS
jgi:hypothetical protein